MVGDKVNWNVEFAKLLKERDNKKSIGAIIGEIIGLDPIKVSVFGNKVILNKNNLYICDNIISHSKEAYIKLNSIPEHGQIATEGEITYNNILKVGDSVMLIAIENGQKFFLVDKVI